MAPKGERFEMRVEEGLVEALDQWRARQDGFPSRAEAARRLLEEGLARGAADPDAPFNAADKMLLAMMADLFRHLKVEDAEVDPEFVGKVIRGGHGWALKETYHGLFHEHQDDTRDVRLVCDVLQMWSVVESSFSKLSTEEQERVRVEAYPYGHEVRFRGFDGNHEVELLSIARFLIEEMDRFTVFKGRELNSHAPTARHYGLMATTFASLRIGGSALTVDQVIKVVRSRPIPMSFVVGHLQEQPQAD